MVIVIASNTTICRKVLIVGKMTVMTNSYEIEMNQQTLADNSNIKIL